jgi:threonine dehydrogenase-like Zn-dependent dehydrogenase
VQFLLETGPGVVEVVEGDSPALIDDHVRVEVAYVGVCHSDTAHVAGRTGPFPHRMGHEVSGIVAESVVESIPVGTRVSVYIADGYATEVMVPAERIIPLHRDASLLDAALAEPLACVIGGIEMLDLTHISEVVLVGGGFMGLMALRFLVAAGHNVTVIEPREFARGLATKWGAERTFAPDEVPSDFARNKPVVVEATGGAPGLQLASDLVEIAGTLGIMGYHQSGGGKRTVDMESWNYRALRVLSLHHRSNENVMRWMDRAQRLAAHKILLPSELVDARLTMEELPSAFDGQPHPNSIKTVLEVAGEPN